MSNNSLKINVLLIICLVLPLTARGETIQLVEESSILKPDILQSYSNEQLRDIQNLKDTLVKFVKESNEKKSVFLSSTYKKKFKDVQKELYSAFDKEKYLRMDILRTEYFDQKATIKTNLYWTDEGYEGVQTFYFIFSKENGKWLIDWLIY